MSATPHISIIVAAARNGVIGRDNELPWRLSEDLKRFKRLTTGHAVIMGRRTFESIGRPLPNRRNIVLTRRGDFQPAGVTVRRSLREAVDAAGAGDEVFIIGGEQVYREALPLADRVYLTRVEAEAAGDATFPALEEATWREVERDRREADEANEHSADYLVYDRRHD